MISSQAASRSATRYFVPFLFAVITVVAVLAAPVPGVAHQGTAQQAATGPKILSLEDYPRWSRIGNVALSPDGRHLALVPDNQVWVRSFDSLEAAPLDGTNGATYPFWSPDSAWDGRT